MLRETLSESKRAQCGARVSLPLPGLQQIVDQVPGSVVRAGNVKVGAWSSAKCGPYSAQGLRSKEHALTTRAECHRNSAPGSVLQHLRGAARARQLLGRSDIMVPDGHARGIVVYAPRPGVAFELISVKPQGSTTRALIDQEEASLALRHR